MDGFDPNGSDQAKVISTYPIENGLKNVLGIIHAVAWVSIPSIPYGRKRASFRFSRPLDKAGFNGIHRKKKMEIVLWNGFKPIFTVKTLCGLVFRFDEDGKNPYVQV